MKLLFLALSFFVALEANAQAFRGSGDDVTDCFGRKHASDPRVITFSYSLESKSKRSRKHYLRVYTGPCGSNNAYLRVEVSRHGTRLDKKGTFRVMFSNSRLWIESSGTWKIRRAS